MAAKRQVGPVRHFMMVEGEDGKPRRVEVTDMPGTIGIGDRGRIRRIRFSSEADTLVRDKHNHKP